MKVWQIAAVLSGNGLYKGDPLDIRSEMVQMKEVCSACWDTH